MTVSKKHLKMKGVEKNDQVFGVKISARLKKDIEKARRRGIDVSASVRSFLEEVCGG